jgi:hypothetical protein
MTECVVFHARDQEEEFDRERKGKMGASLPFLSRKGFEGPWGVCAQSVMVRAWEWTRVLLETVGQRRGKDEDMNIDIRRVT